MEDNSENICDKCKKKVNCPIDDGSDVEWDEHGHGISICPAYEKVKKMEGNKDDLPEFVFKEAEDSTKEVYTIYGEKGDGKTTLAFGFPGRIACLSFDRKSNIIKKEFYNNDKRIKVYNCVEHLKEEPSLYTKSSYETYKYCLFILDGIDAKETKPDWLVIDGLEIFARIGEMVMRYNNNLKPFQGIVNQNIWKERRLILRNIHNKALSIANKGIIYTTYTDKYEIIEEGTIKTKQKIPKWTDTIMWETDIVLHTYAKQDEKGKKFFVNCVSSKLKNRIKTGIVIDVTDKKIPLLFEENV